jgi:hypothetical protein
VAVGNRLFEGFGSKLTSSIWAATAKRSPDNAWRDLSDRLVRGMMRKSAAGGCGTSYLLNKDNNGLPY